MTGEVIDEMVAWRYWGIPHRLLSPERVELVSQHQMLWVAGKNMAACPLDRSHIPPHPDCECGIWALGHLDAQYAAKSAGFIWREHMAEIPGLPADPVAQIEFLRRLGRRRLHTEKHRHWFEVHQPQTLRLVGRVLLYGAVEWTEDDIQLGPERRCGDGRAWRAAGATIEELFLDPASDALDIAGCDAGELRMALADRYKVPVSTGFPRYTEAEWAERAAGGGWSALGLNPPNFQSKPKYFVIKPRPQNGKQLDEKLSRGNDMPAPTPQVVDPGPFDELVRWRYWVIPARLLSPRRAKLKPGDPKDRSVWGRGVTRAQCRHDPSHVPPHPDCTCGIYAIGGADIHYAAVQRAVIWREWVDAALTRMNGNQRSGLFGAQAPRSPLAQVELVNSVDWSDLPQDERLSLHEINVYHPQHQYVLGRVKLRNAVAVDNPERKFMQPWRAESATIEALYLDESDAAEDMGCDLDELCAALADRYGVACEVGLPPYSQADWDARTLLSGKEGLWDEYGLYAPGCEPAPRDFRLVNRRPAREVSSDAGGKYRTVTGSGTCDPAAARAQRRRRREEAEEAEYRRQQLAIVDRRRAEEYERHRRAYEDRHRE